MVVHRDRIWIPTPRHCSGDGNMQGHEAIQQVLESRVSCFPDSDNGEAKKNNRKRLSYIYIFKN